MNPTEILDIIKAFFNALRSILIALGIMKEEQTAEESTTVAA